MDRHPLEAPWVGNAPETSLIPTKEDILRRWGYDDPLIHACFQAQTQHNLTDDELYRLIIQALADRHVHMQAQLLRAYQTPPFGGSFTIAHAGLTSPPLPHDASSEAINAALTDLVAQVREEGKTFF